MVSYGSKMLIKLFLVLLVTFLLNLPFGYWRQGLRKFSLPWWLAIHLPVPLVIAFRIGLKIPYATVPLIIAAAVFGQWAGGRLRPASPDRPAAPRPASHQKARDTL